MRRTAFIAILVFAFPTLASAQSSAADSATLRELLAEVRELRQELHTTTVAFQRAQILIHRVEAQQAAVGRAFQRLEDARAKLAQVHDHRTHQEANVRQFQDSRSENENPAQRKQADETVEWIKSEIEKSIAEEANTQAKVSEYEDQLRLEQSKLDDLESRLDRLDKDLESSAPPR